MEVGWCLSSSSTPVFSVIFVPSFIMFHYSFIDGIESLFILYSPLSDSDDEDNEVIYNPKNLPLGWDGKPIPYWLYKLHGLNISYSCEICGNQVCYDLS